MYGGPHSQDWFCGSAACVFQQDPPSEGPARGLLLCFHHLEILNPCPTKACVFILALGPTNDTVDTASGHGASYLDRAHPSMGARSQAYVGWEILWPILEPLSATWFMQVPVPRMPLLFFPAQPPWQGPLHTGPYNGKAFLSQLPPHPVSSTPLLGQDVLSESLMCKMSEKGVPLSVGAWDKRLIQTIPNPWVPSHTTLRK